MDRGGPSFVSLGVRRRKAQVIYSVHGDRFPGSGKRSGDNSNVKLRGLDEQLRLLCPSRRVFACKRGKSRCIYLLRLRAWKFVMFLSNASVRRVVALAYTVVSSRPLTVDLLRDCIGGAPFLHLATGFGDTLRTLPMLDTRPMRLLFLSVRVPRLDNVRFSQVLRTSAHVVFAATFRRCTLSDCGIGTLSCLLGPVDCPSFLGTTGGTLR